MKKLKSAKRVDTFSLTCRYTQLIIMKKYIFLFILTLLFTCSDDEGNLCQYQPTLTTLEADEITEFTATLNGLVSVVSQNCDDPINTEQGFVYSTEIQPTVNDNQVNVNGVEIRKSSAKHHILCKSIFN